VLRTKAGNVTVMFDAVSAPTVKGKSCVFLNNGFELNSVSNAIDFRDFLIPFC
jgi:hypothetical protein